nr:vp91 [Apis mellifera nudivirus]
MDFTLSVFIVLMIICVLGVFVFNQVKRTKRLDLLLRDLLLRQPNTVAFSLGYDTTRGQYKNATIGKEGTVAIRYDNYPVAHDGQFIILKEHGNIVPASNGYHMTGMDTVRMLCPQGYEGIDCHLKPLCEPTDKGKNKPLTYTQFNGLGLYRNNFQTNVRTKRDVTEETTHPRIRIHCLSNGKYELQTCPDGKLLDNQLNCQPYDICIDRLTGFKHIYPTSNNENPLLETEYYVCENNHSVRRECSEGTVFSSATKNCVIRSICYGRGSDTISIDDHNYIQCSGDTGQKIHCEMGVIQHEGRHKCRIDVCKPRTFNVTTNQLHYDYGEVQCDINDEAVEKFCDTNTVASPYSMRLTWAQSENVDPYENWPKEVLKNHKCQPPNPDDIIVDSSHIVDIRWTQLMPTAYPFDLKTGQYVCTKPTNKYRVDYENSRISPELPSSQFYVEVARPCHADILPIWHLPWRNFEPALKLPPNKLTAVVGIGYDFAALQACSDRLWPVKRKSDNVYCFARIRENNKNMSYIVEECEDTNLPIGFSEPDKEGGLSTDQYSLLNLTGYGQPKTLDEATQNVWYTLATGKYDIVTSRNEQADTFKIVKRTEIMCPSSIDMNKDASFGIMWSHLDSSIQSFNNGKLSISRTGWTFNNTTNAPPGFFTTTISPRVLTYRDKSFTLTASITINYTDNRDEGL